MTAQRLHTAAVGTIAAGACTLTFDATPQGLVWTGTISVPASDLGATWTAYIGENVASARPLGSWLGRAVFGPVQTYGRERLLVVGSGLTSTGQLQAVLLGQSEDESQAVPASPLPFVSSLSVAQLVVNQSLCVDGAGGSEICIAPSTLGYPGILFRDGATVTDGLITMTGGNSLGLYSPAQAGLVQALLELLSNGANGAVSVNAELDVVAGNLAKIGSDTVPVVNEPVGTVQWQIKTGSTVNNFGVTNPVAVAFTNPFPSQLISVIVANGDGSPRGAVFNAESRSVNGFNIFGTGTAGNSRVDWVAFGY